MASATVAHGFLTLSLLSAMNYDCLPRIIEQTMGINYGFDKVRFVNPVKVGQKIRATSVLSAVEFDGQRDCRRVEVYNVSGDRVLPAKARPELISPQPRPQQPLGVGQRGQVRHLPVRDQVHLDRPAGRGGHERRPVLAPAHEQRTTVDEGPDAAIGPHEEPDAAEHLDHRLGRVLQRGGRGGPGSGGRERQLARRVVGGPCGPPDQRGDPSA